ncbi:MAG: NAD(P)-dependent oxidoreductase [Pararhodobacter sp.]
MKICVLGANGNLGRRVVARALAEGHEVTAGLRDASRLPAEFAGKVGVASVDFDSDAALAAAMQGQDVVVNAAGHVSNPDFTALVARVVRLAESTLGEGGRFWMLAGAALLDVPGTTRMTVELPMVPAFYRRHRENFTVLQQTRLDWSTLCPGPMIDAPDGKATEGLILSADTWPLPRPAIAGYLPGIASSIAFVRSVPRMTIYYEDAAKVILDHLAPKGRFAQRRVGIALPEGQTRRKA